jgi:hypothetical protein
LARRRPKARAVWPALIALALCKGPSPRPGLISLHRRRRVAFAEAGDSTDEAPSAGPAAALPQLCALWYKARGGNCYRSVPRLARTAAVAPQRLSLYSGGNRHLLGHEAGPAPDLPILCGGAGHLQNRLL